MTEPPANTRGVYGIAVAAELTGVAAQTLRLYEKKGLLNPTRTSGGTRRYSEFDLASVRRVSQLLLEGLNLASIRRVVELETANAALRRRISELSR